MIQTKSLMLRPRTANSVGESMMKWLWKSPALLLASWLKESNAYATPFPQTAGRSVPS
jgi:hypothetical protein